MTVALKVLMTLLQQGWSVDLIPYKLLGTGTNVAVTLKVSVLLLHDLQSGTMYQLLSSL